MKQRGFDFAEPPPMPAHCPTGRVEAIPPADPNVHPADVKRLVGQNLAILELLRSKPESCSAELARISLKYTSRTHDLRKKGFIIRERRDENNVHWYSLVEGHP